MERYAFQAVKAGIELDTFWGYTLGEINMVMDAKIKRNEEDMKQEALLHYTLSSLIAKGFGLAMGSKQPFPTLEKAYPYLFTEEEQKRRRQNEIKQRMLKFAAGRNKEVKELGRKT